MSMLVRLFWILGSANLRSMSKLNVSHLNDEGFDGNGHNGYYLGHFFAFHLNASAGLRILNVGSDTSESGLYKSLGSPKWQWTGIDLQSGPHVDVVLNDPYKFPFQDDAFDVAICLSVMEHVEFFWVFVLELFRVVREWVYLDMITGGAYHAYPQDYWRFRDDASNGLARWAARNGMEVSLAWSQINDYPIWYGLARYAPMIAIYYMGTSLSLEKAIQGQHKRDGNFRFYKYFLPEVVQRYAKKCWGRLHWGLMLHQYHGGIVFPKSGRLDIPRVLLTWSVKSIHDESPATIFS